MKRIAALTSLALLLAACGSPPQPANTPTPDSGGFLVEGRPDLKPRKITLPVAKPLPLRATATSQSLRSASLPAWTGPTKFQVFPYSFPNIAINSSGALFFQRGTDGAHGPKLTKFTPNGQVIGEQIFPFTDDFTPTYHWIVVTEDSPTKETYQIARGLGDFSKRAQILSDSMQVLNTNSDGPVYPLYGTTGTDDYFNSELVFKPGRQGIVMFANHRGSSEKRVDVYELVHEPWDSIEPEQRTTFLRPSRYSKDTNYITADIATSNDGSIYLAMFVNYISGCVGVCPSVAGVTKIVNGEIIWQNYWDADEPIALRHIAANNTSVSLLVTRKGDTDFTQHILTFNANGDPQSDMQLPLETLRQQYPEENIGFSRFELGENGKFVLMGGKILASGDLIGGMNHSYVIPADSDYAGGTFYDIATQGEYVYVEGYMGDTFENIFILPFDSNLNRRY